MDTSQLKLIDIAYLRKGMFVQLDLGWLSHPFAADSFKVTTDEQIHTLRSLGLTELRYVPCKSDPVVVAAIALGGLPDRDSPGGTAQGGDASLADDQRRRDQLDAQVASLQACEEQFAAAVLAYGEIARLSHTNPAAARAQSVLLVKACVIGLRNHGDSGVRLVSDMPGERTAVHSVNVMVVALLLGKALGQSEQDLMALGLVALLHDLGKLDLPLPTQSLDGNFGPEEILEHQSHVALSVSACERMGLSERVVLGVAQHHEMVDGSGYPLKLQGSRMGIQGKIVALANCYDNLCNPPQEGAVALAPHDALSVIFALMKARFDAEVLGAFIRMMGVYPPGSVVQLVNDRFAMVVSVNSSRPLRPRIIAFDARVPREEAPVLDMEAMPELGIRRSVKPSELPGAVRHYLRPRQRVCCFFERTFHVFD